MATSWLHSTIDGLYHVVVQNNAVKCLSGILLYYYAKLVWPFSILLYNNMAVSSRGCKPRIGTPLHRYRRGCGFKYRSNLKLSGFPFETAII